MRPVLIALLLLCIADVVWAGHPPRFRRQALYLPDGVTPFVDLHTNQTGFAYYMGVTNAVEPVMVSWDSAGNDGLVHLGLSTEPAYIAAADGTNATYLLDGANDFLETSAGDILDSATNVSMSLWFLASTGLGGNDGLIVNFAAGLQGALLRVDQVGGQPFKIEFRAKSSGGTATPLLPTNLVTVVRWHHAAATWDLSNGATKLYLDGVLIASAASSPATGTMDLNGRKWQIGNDPTSGNRTFSGNLYRAFLYDLILSAQDVLDQFLFTGPDNQNADSEQIPTTAP